MGFAGTKEGFFSSLVSDGFKSSLVTKIIDNVQIKVGKVHIRYEDERKGKVSKRLWAL